MTSYEVSVSSVEVCVSSADHLVSKSSSVEWLCLVGGSDTWQERNHATFDWTRMIMNTHLSTGHTHCHST